MNWLKKMFEVQSKKDLLDNYCKLFKINQSKTANRLIRISLFSFFSVVEASSNFFLENDVIMLTNTLANGVIFKTLSDAFILGGEYIWSLGMLGSECLLLGTLVSLGEGLFVRIFGLDRNHWNNIYESELKLNKTGIELDIELNTKKEYQKIIAAIIEKLKRSGKIKDDSEFYDLLATNEENLEFSELDSKLSEFEGLIREKLIVEKYFRTISHKKNGLFVSRRLSLKIAGALLVIYSSAFVSFFLKFVIAIACLRLITEAMVNAFFFTLLAPLIPLFMVMGHFSKKEEQASMQSLKDSFDEAKETFRFDTLNKYQSSDLNAIKQEMSSLSKKIISDCVILFDKLSSDHVEGEEPQDITAKKDQKGISPVITEGMAECQKPYTRVKKAEEN